VMMRQIESTRTNDAKDSAFRPILMEKDELKSLQKNLGKQKSLIEFVCFDDSISAFVVTDENIHFVANLTEESEILTLLESLQFQFGALRYGAKNLGNFIGELKKRADFYLQKLYEKLVRPLENLIGERDLVIVPAGATHYVPFHALRRSNEKYLIETREIALSRPVRLIHPRWPLYVVPRPDGRFLIGATTIESEDTGVSLRSALELLSAAYALHPTFGEARIVEFGAGLRPALPDHAPRIRVSGRRIAVNGLYRHGFLLAPALAELTLNYVRDGATDDEVMEWS